MSEAVKKKETLRGESSKKVLIVKLGHSETLLDDRGSICSLGDVFRTTPLLHTMKNDEVTWLTNAKALPLLRGNPYIQHLFPWNQNSIDQLLIRTFDTVINLEKNRSVCSFVHQIKADQKYGFTLASDPEEGVLFWNGCESLDIDNSEYLIKLNGRTWEQTLFSMLGHTWNGESYILGTPATSKIEFDIGFNMHVGSKFPLKAWPASHWDRLEKLIKSKYRFMRQRHLNDLEGYINWINSCRILVTNDSLGLHLGIALGKKVLALFGPTSSTELTPVKNLRILKPDVDRSCMPCYKPVCDYQESCMVFISPEKVLAAIDQWGK